MPFNDYSFSDSGDPDPTESFPGYRVVTSDTNIVFHFFVLGYALLSFLLIAPLVIWGRKHERLRAAALARAGFYNQQDEFSEYDNYNMNINHNPTAMHNNAIHPLEQSPMIRLDSPFQDPHIQQPVFPPVRPSPFVSVISRIDRVATTAYPDEDPDFMSQLSGSQHRSQVSAVHSNRSRRSGSRSRSQVSGSQRQQQPSIDGTPSHTSRNPSNVPSAATTSRLYEQRLNRPKTQVWDVPARRWKSRRPIGRPDFIHQAYQEELSSMGGHSSGRQSLGRVNRFGASANNHTMMSDVASSILTDDFDGPPLVHQRVIISYNQRHQRSYSSASSEHTFLQGTVVDDIYPNDAADAGDPGRINPLEQVEPVELTVCCGAGALWRPYTIGVAFDGLVELAEPDIEMKRIIAMGIPLTLGAVANPIFHIINISFVANFISTDAMVAYVIVHLMLGLTNELIGAVADAQSTLCSRALSMGNWLLAGQYAQIALVVIIALNVPLLLMWYSVMDDLVDWLIGSDEIAAIAQQYTRRIIAYQVLDGVSRSLAVLFHLAGYEKFETRFAIGEGIITVIGVTLIASLSPNADLNAVGGIQLIIGIAAFVVKVFYAVLRGWLSIFMKGMKTCAIMKLEVVADLVRTTLPLFIGAFLQYGEWEILLFFVRSMGPAEVATWAVVSVIWKLLETATEGFGEAAAIRVAYHLGSGQPDLARHASHKALFISTLQALLITSALLMGGKNIATVLSPDPMLQLLLNSIITNMALGNIVMNAAMSVWSLVGAQGRYRLATLVILLARWIVTIPIALVCIYVFEYDLNSVMGAVTTGFSTSVLILSYILFRSDWDRLSRIMEELNAMLGQDYSESSEDSSSSDSEEDSEEDFAKKHDEESSVNGAESDGDHLPKPSIDEEGPP